MDFSLICWRSGGKKVEEMFFWFILIGLDEYFRGGSEVGRRLREIS